MYMYLYIYIYIYIHASQGPAEGNTATQPWYKQIYIDTYINIKI